MGTLYICSTPIGNLDDVSKRLIDVLSDVNLIYCEDTRRAKILLNHLGIKTEIESYFIGNELSKIEDIKNQNITKSVHVEAEWNDEPGAWGETLWLHEINKEHNFPNSIVGHVNLSNDNVEHVINKHLEASNLFVGIRHNQFNHDKDKDFIL